MGFIPSTSPLGVEEWSKHLEVKKKEQPTADYSESAHLHLKQNAIREHDISMAIPDLFPERISERSSLAINTRQAIMHQNSTVDVIDGYGQVAASYS